jgi:hypothetical protein
VGEAFTVSGQTPNLPGILACGAALVFFERNISIAQCMSRVLTRESRERITQVTIDLGCRKVRAAP